jgi:nicotinamide-nucleotide adenylyltransferase
MIGIICGRFQPLHLGHIELIEMALKEVDKLYIIIGSAEKNHTQINPFSASERFEMINRTIISLKLKDKIEIFQIKDCIDNNLWIAEIKSYVPPFDIVFVNEPVTKRLMKESGYEVKGQLFFDRSIYSGTNIRRLMLKDQNNMFFGESDKWQSFVPKAVVEVIEEIDGINRIKDLSCSDC